MSARRTLEAARLLALAGAGFGLALHYARMGFMPLDQAIVFDGAWRTLCGQVPFRDYTAPNGFPVHALQALFFAVFGVGWLAYALHAAVINGLFVLLVDRLLLLVGLRRWASSAFALASAFALYPPFGAPYMDQHAFFFSLAALAAAVASARSGDARVRRWSGFAVGPLLALAYLCKQIPSVLFVPAVVAVALGSRHGKAKAIWRIAAGAFVASVALLAAAAALGVDWELLDTYWRRLPAEEGARRLGYVPGVASVLARFEETREKLGLWTIGLVHALALAGILLPIAPALRRRAGWRDAWGCFVLGEFLMVAGLLFVALTSNDKEIGAGLVFASAGCVAAGFERARMELAETGRAGWARVAVLVQVALVLVAARDVRKFDVEVNRTRKVNDVAFDAALADQASTELPEGLGALRWSVPKRVPYSAKDVREVVEFLRGQEGGVFLLGDFGLLYGLTRKVPTSPSLWFHPGLTMPRPYDEGFAEYEARLIENLERESVRWIVLEGEHTWVGYARDPEEVPPKAAWVELGTFPRLAAMVEERGVGERVFGGFRVIEMGRGVGR
jgi:hypothetical protein